LRGELQANWSVCISVTIACRNSKQNGARPRRTTRAIIGALLQLIDLYEKLGEQPQQLAWLERLVAASPKSNEYRLRLARLLAQLDHLDRAAAAFDVLLGTETAQH
jgi:tetratricopeptide (TPR) repeat protein